VKEGYLQLKIAELNEKIAKIEELIKFEESKLELLQEKVGEYKEVIKKLKDIDQFKQQSLDELRKENKNIIDEQTKQLTRQLTKLHQDLLESKAMDINKILDEIKKREHHLKQQTVSFEQQRKDLVYLKEYTDILVMKLVNKNILSAQDVNQLENRSAKKAEKEQ